MVKLNMDEILKGTIIAIVLMVGMALGALLNIQGVNGFIIWFVVSAINIVAAIFVYKFIKIELAKKPEQAAPAPEEDVKSAKKKKVVAASEEKEDKFETPADKKAE